jgi:hypothetical protein
MQKSYSMSILMYSVHAYVQQRSVYIQKPTEALAVLAAGSPAEGTVEGAADGNALALATTESVGTAVSVGIAVSVGVAVAVSVGKKARQVVKTTGVGSGMMGPPGLTPDGMPVGGVSVSVLVGADKKGPPEPDRGGISELTGVVALPEATTAEEAGASEPTGTIGVAVGVANVSVRQVV